MRSLQQHKQAVAKVNLKKEFLSGAGCASLLLLKDSDIEDLLKKDAQPETVNSTEAAGASAVEPDSTSVKLLENLATRGPQGSSLRRRRIVPVQDDLQLDLKRLTYRSAWMQEAF